MMNLNQVEFKSSPNFSIGRHGDSITHIVIHTMIGSMSGTLSWFQNPASQVSAHYLVSKEGQVVQMVADSNKAWHVCNANPFCIGIELEDLNPQTKKTSMNDPGWFTLEQISTTAQLTAALMKEYNVPIENVIGHNDQFLKQYGNTHQDPGPYYPWGKFKSLIQQELGSGS